MGRDVWTNLRKAIVFFVVVDVFNLALVTPPPAWDSRISTGSVVSRCQGLGSPCAPAGPANTGTILVTLLCWYILGFSCVPNGISVRVCSVQCPQVSFAYITYTVYNSVSLRCSGCGLKLAFSYPPKCPTFLAQLKYISSHFLSLPPPASCFWFSGKLDRLCTFCF